MTAGGSPFQPSSDPDIDISSSFSSGRSDLVVGSVKSLEEVDLKSGENA
jgi:hypothetical protein